MNTTTSLLVLTRLDQFNGFKRYAYAEPTPNNLMKTVLATRMENKRKQRGYPLPRGKQCLVAKSSKEVSE
tara:strand:+ start:123 stop:332 length:210 start_codon:yes stop_codon:yes gene_type:complete